MEQNKDLIPVQCTCGHHLGKFNAWDDHGTIEMECPNCKEVVLIHSQELSYNHTITTEDGNYAERTPEQGPLIAKRA